MRLTLDHNVIIDLASGYITIAAFARSLQRAGNVINAFSHTLDPKRSLKYVDSGHSL